MPLPGIRLTDLYNSEDYNKWMNDSTNVRLVRSTIDEYSGDDPELIKGHLYVNSKIKQDLGEEFFNSIPEDTGLKAKIDLYNANLPQVPEEDTVARGTSGYYRPPVPETDGDIVPTSDNKHAMWDWFKERSDGAADRMYEQYLNANRKQNKRTVINPLDNKNELTQDYQELERLREEEPENTATIKLLENALTAKINRKKEEEEVAAQKASNALDDFRFVFDNFDDSRYLPIEREKWDSATAVNTINSLSEEIRGKLDTDPQFAFSAFEQFDRLADEMIPQYRNYHDTNAMPITPNEMKDIMAQYYAVRTIKDLDEANNFAQSTFQSVLAKHQSLIQKSEVALHQATQDFTGNMAAVIGIVANTPNAIAWSLRNDMDIEDLSNFKEFLYYTTQNPLTEWGNNLQKTGTWLPDAQQRFKEMEYNQWQLQREAGKETKFLDINTPFELFAQGAYTVAGMATGTAAAQILSNSVGKAGATMATRMLSREGAGWGTRLTARAINTLGNAIAVGATAYLPAAAEASMDAMEKYEAVKEAAQNDVLSALEKELQRDAEDGTFEDWYQRNSRLPMPVAGEDERQAQLRMQEREYLWEQYRNLKAQQVLDDPDIQKAIDNEAFRTGAKTMFDEATWIAFGDMFFSNILGRGFKELKKGVVRAATGKPVTHYNWTPEGTYLKAIPKQVTPMQKALAVGKGVFEAVEEGVEELFQTVDSKMREDLAHNYIKEYIANRYDPEAIGQLSDSLRENWDVAKQSIGENVFSEEALYSFLLGAVSAGIGSPTVMRGIRTGSDTMKKTGSFKQALKEGFKASWRNPIAENLQDLKVKEIKDADEAAEINRWMQQHPEISTYNDETAILKFIADKEDAARRDDEVSYRDALMGQKISTMLMMDRVNPNGMKLNFHARLKAISNLNASSPEARAIVDQMLRDDDSIVRTTEGPLNEDEVAVLNKAIKRAKEDINIYKNVKAQMSILDSQFGNSISTETKEALAYGLIMGENWGTRIDEIVKNAKESYNKANPENQIIPISAEEAAIKDAVARYGSSAVVDAEYKNLIARRNALKAGRRHMYRFEYKNELDKVTQQLKENRAAKQLLDREELPIITANEILSLSNKARAYLLDESNKKNYSAAQQKEINAFTSAEGINGQILTDLKDAGRLENKANYYRNQYNELVKSNGALVPIFDREVRAEAAEKWSRARLENTLNATTYEEFRDELDKALATGEFTSNDKAQFSKIFSDPANINKDSYKFYQQYQKEELDRAQTRRIIENSPAFKELSEPQKQVASEVISEQQLTKTPLTAQNIIERLNDPKFTEKLTRDELEQLAVAMEKIMRQKESYDKTVAAEKERQAKLAKAKMKETTPRGTPSGQSQPDTIINNSKYQSSREFFNNIFKKVAAIFTNNNPQSLTKEEFINLIGLYTESPLSSDIMGEDFDTTLTLANFGRIISGLLKTVENAAYLNPEVASDIKYQNTMQLIGTLKGIVQIVTKSQDTANPLDLNAFIRNSIIQVNSALIPDFRAKKIELPKRLKEFQSKAFSALGSNAERKWFTDNDIQGNLARVAALRAHKQEYVFIKDNSLIYDVQQELKVDDFTDDTLPIILAAKVKEGTEGAVQLEDGNYYLYVGLLQDSRVNPGLYDRNELNALRNIALEQEESGPIKNKGKVYISQGAVINYTNKSEDTETQTDSLKEWLLDKHKGDKKAAKEDFVKHFRRAKATINTETHTAAISYEWNGQTIHRTFQTDNTHPEWIYSVYLLEKPDGTVEPKILFVRELDEFTFDDETGVSDVYEALNGELLTDKKFKDLPEFNFLRRPVNYVANIIKTNIPGLKAKRGTTKAAAAKDISEAVDNYLSKRFNFKKVARENPEFHVKVVVEDDTLKLKAYQRTDVGEEQYKDMPSVLSSLPIESIDSVESVVRFAQEGIKNLMFDEEGTLRRDEGGNPLVKLEVKFAENEKTESTKKIFDADKVEDLFTANAWKLLDTKMNPVPESIAVNPTVQGGTAPIKRTGNVVQDAITAITQPEFIDTHEGEHYEVGPNETEVTTFIRGGEEASDFDGLAGQLAKNLGTSVDKLYRVWREKRTVDSVTNYMRANNFSSWVGIRRTEIPMMCQQFERIEKFFAQRGETPIPANLIFSGPININGKTHHFLGKPDIVTVDKNGKYHIYDMKSFRYQSGVTKTVPGFTTDRFVINGMRNLDRDYEHWQQQMSIYRMLIESKLGKDTVVPEFGVIPVRLGYNVEGTVSDYTIEGIGAKKITGKDGKAFHLSFASAPFEQAPNRAAEPLTRCYDDAIRIPAILDITTINPTGWKQMSKADELRSSLDQVRQNRTSVKEDPKPTVEVVSSPTSTRKLSSMSQDEIAAEIAGPEIDVSIEDLIDGACS